MAELFVPITFDGDRFKKDMIAWWETNLSDFESQKEADSALNDWVDMNIGRYVGVTV